MEVVTNQSSSPAWVRPFLVAESILFPLGFLALAGMTVWKSFEPGEQLIPNARTAWSTAGVLLDLVLHPVKLAPGVPHIRIYDALAVVLVRPLILFFFNVLCAVFIALRARLRYEPGSLREIIVPMIGTTIILFLPASEHFPAWLGHPFTYPSAWVTGILAAAAALSVVGALVALNGLLHLRRNFSVFVEVREIVLSGPYRYVRHPIYMGEILLSAGLVLAAPSAFSLVLFFLLVIFQYARGRMEERRLAAVSPEYAERMVATGMFFPRFRASRPLQMAAPTAPACRDKTQVIDPARARGDSTEA